jgi:capsular polysaccharide biosynthesis protein
MLPDLDAVRLRTALRRRASLTKQLFGLLTTLDKAGFRVGKHVVYFIGYLDKTYRRKVGWPRLSSASSFAGVREVRRRPSHLTGFRGLNTVGEATTVVFTDKRDRAYLRYVFDYPRNRQRFLSPFVCRLDRPFLHVPKGAVATSDRVFVAESVCSKVLRFVAATPPPIAPPFRPGISTTIQAYSSRNYYHWLIDCLPRTYLLATANLTEPVALLVPERLAPFQQTSLACCLPEHVQVVPIKEEWVQVEQLLLPSFVSEPTTGFLPAACLAYLRTRIFERLGVDPAAAPTRRLYVSRAGTHHRRVLNEPEIIERLRERGFEVCCPERLSFEEQVRLFHSAEVVIGSRGAGLANMLFSSRLKVLELTSRSPFAGACYFSLAHALGHQYFHLFARRTVGADFEFDPAALNKTLCDMGIRG